MSSQAFSKNIFKNATLRLTLTYLMIMSAICLIFNLVILSTASVNSRDVMIPTQENIIIDGSIDENITQRIISARDRQANKQLALSLYMLDATILIAGGFGCYWLAKKTLNPIEESHKLQAQFVSNASHELKTPLAALQLETEMILREKSPSKADMKEVLESNLEEAKSLSSLTQMLLRLSQIDERIETSPVNITQIVKGRIDKFSDNSIEFSATKDFIVQSNETAIEELTNILLDNASKYRIGYEPIKVNILRKNRVAVLEVSNASEEISKENLDKIFDRFYREDNVRTRCGQCDGHGLGLAIAKQLVELLDGSLSVRNERFIDKGEANYRTTFSIGFHFAK